MARRKRSTSRQSLVVVLGLLVGVGACGQILGVNDYEVVDADALGGAQSGGFETGGDAGDEGVGGRNLGGSETGGAEAGGAAGGETGGADTGGTAGEPNGGVAGTPSGGVAGTPSGGVGGEPGGGAAGRDDGGAAGRETGGSGGETGGAAGRGGGGAGGGGGCDPLDPVPVCGADARCVPQGSSTAPTCESGVGSREAYRHCTRDENCLAGHTCVQITPDEPPEGDPTDPDNYFPGNTDSAVCVQWCRVGHPEDCAVATEECFPMSPARYIGAQQWGVCTPPEASSGALYDYEPPPAWICNDAYWGQDGYCDCGCGVFDPDCDADLDTVCNCEVPSCANSGDDVEIYECNNRLDPTNNAVCLDVPTEWAPCNLNFWGTFDGCDCGCGAFDPDCSSTAASACDFCGSGSCGADNPPGSCTGIDPNDNSVCL